VLLHLRIDPCPPGHKIPEKKVMRSLFQDLRFALRQMRRSPGFALTAIATLALGIGANVAVFGVLQALILRPFDVNLSWPEIRDVHDQNRVFSSVAGLRVSDFGMEANNATHPVWGYEISGEYFSVLRVRPALGRLLQPSDNAHPGASQVAVLSWAAWKSYFGGDPGILGKTIRIDKHPTTIVGVAPAGFYGTEKFMQPDLFVPMVNEEQFEGYAWLEARYDRGCWAVVSLRNGVTPAQAQDDLNTIAARIATLHPKDEEHLKLKLSKPGLLGDLFGGPARGFLAGVMGLAVIVLLAACANLGSLFAARTADRAREIAIRMAIGSTRRRIVRQVLTEAVVISIFGGACACTLAWFGLSALGRYHPPGNFPIQLAVMPQPSLLAAAFLISILAGMLFGLMPLRQILAADPNEAIKAGSSHQGAGRRWAFRDVLLAVQIALCCVTVTAAFVSLRGLQKAVSMQFGFNPDNALIAKFDLGLAGYSKESAARFQHQLLNRVSQLPGVQSAGYANTTPLALDQSTWSIYPQSAVEFRRSTQAFEASIYSISPGYLHAAGTNLLSGRDVSLSDGPKSPTVAIVNQEFVRRLFHTDQAVGRYYKDGGGRLIRIIGIVEDGKYQGISEAPQPAMFFSIEQNQYTATSIVVRTRPGVTGMTLTLRQAIRDLDPAVPVQESSGWRHQLGLQLFPARAATITLSLFGLFGLLLSITGTFGLASYTVTKRLRELSIRVALGAQAKQILSASLGRMLVLLASGSAVGLLLGVAAGKLLAAIVYQASAQDPVVLFAVALTMLLTGSLSVAAPVRRALRIDPARLLRED
jgi:predicted permease